VEEEQVFFVHKEKTIYRRECVWRKGRKKRKEEGPWTFFSTNSFRWGGFLLPLQRGKGRGPDCDPVKGLRRFGGLGGGAKSIMVAEED